LRVFIAPAISSSSFCVKLMETRFDCAITFFLLYKI
jgi:hypothetical protein